MGSREFGEGYGNVLKLDMVAHLYTFTKITELYTFNEWFLWTVKLYLNKAVKNSNINCFIKVAKCDFMYIIIYANCEDILKNHAPPVYTVLNVIYILKICQQITGGLEIVIPKKAIKGLSH